MPETYSILKMCTKQEISYGSRVHSCAVVRSKIFIAILIMIFNFTAFSADTDSLALLIPESKNDQRIELLHKSIVKQLVKNPNLALEYSMESIDLSKQLQRDSLLAYSYYYAALAYYFQDYWNLSADYYTKAMESNWGSTSNLFRARCANNIGICFEYLGEYEKTANYYFQSIAASEQLGDELLTARTQLNLGMLYIRMKEYHKAVEILGISLSVLQKMQDEENIISAYQNLFIAEGNLQNSERLNDYYKQAIDLAQAKNDSAKMSEILNDFGTLLFDKGQFSEANHYFEQALQYADSVNSPSAFYFTLYSIGKNAMYLGNLEKSEKLMSLAFNKLKSLKSNVWLTYIQLNLSRLYARKGDFILSDKFMKDAIANEQELFKNKRAKAISEMQVKYETGKKEQELSMQKLQLKSQSRTLFFALIIALLFASAFLIVFFFMRKIKSNNQQLFERNRELTARWEKLKNPGTSEIEDTESNTISSHISALMNKDQLFKNPDLTIDYLSRSINSNTKYVSRTIKEKTGLNFNSYINTYRIEEAKKILLDPVKKNWSLDAVAESCGFNNPTTFYQTFKKNTGLTPAVYRNITEN